jgi:3-hydroxypropanoate dehydrogenase
MPGNVDKLKSAPVTAIFAFDTRFYDKLDKINPTAKELKSYFIHSEEMAFDTAYKNSTLQAAYFMMIARGVGLDCGPISGFDIVALEKEFLSGLGLKVNFICNLGYADGKNKYPRLPRLEFEECCKLI